MTVATGLKDDGSVEGSNPFLFNTVWIVLLLTIVPEIILRAFLNVDTSWMLAAKIIGLGALVGLTFGWSAIRPLRSFLVILLLIYAVEAWLFGSIISTLPFYTHTFGTGEAAALFGERLLRMGAIAVVLVALLVMGFKRKDFFLTVGNIRAPIEPVKWLGIKQPEPWTRFGRNYAIIATVILLLFMLPALQPTLSNLSIQLIVFAAVCALLNAFAEEFLYRAALLPTLLPLFGKHKALLMTAIWFGMGHWFGIPNGLTGVLITAFGGWIFGKSIVETQGMGWAVFLHFLSDFVIYALLFLVNGV